MSDLGFGLDGILEGVDDEIGADVGIAQPLRQTVRQRLLEAVVVQHQREDEAAERRFSPRDLLGLSRIRPQTGSSFSTDWVLVA